MRLNGISRPAEPVGPPQTIRLSSNAPALSDERTVLGIYRALCAGGPFLILLVGFLQGGSTHDPLWLRAAIGALLLILLGVSFWSPRRFLWTARYSLYALTLWPAALVWFNPAEPFYILSALFLFAAFGLISSLTTQTPSKLARYLVFSFAVNYGAAAAVAPAGLGRISLLVELGLTGVLIYYATLARIRGAHTLARREAAARQAQRVARLGVWQWDRTTGAVTWNTTLYRLFGYRLGEVEPTLQGIRDRFHPEDRERVEAFEQAVYEGRAEGPITFRLVPEGGGAPRWIAADFGVGRDASGRLAWAIGAAYDVTDRIKQEQTLRRAAEASERARQAAEDARAVADQAARAKAALLANMSHEIRTPLTGILGYADLLAEEVDAEAVPFVDAIRRGALRLLQTLSDVLELSRIEGEDYRLRTRPLDLRDAVRTSAELLRAQAEASGLYLSVIVPDTPVEVDTDEEALQRVVFILVSNAIKFTDAGGITVVVRARGEGGGEIEVRDTGRGVSEAFMPRMFDPFRQASEGDGRLYEGTGLGLAIASRLADGMGATIAVASEVGVGSTFSVRFPAGATEPGRSAAPGSRPAAE